jgi:carboxymethylenebutenolidase
MVTAFLAFPELRGRHSAVVIIHEWWGLNDWVKQQAQKLAQQGYISLAVDLYRGRSTTDPEEAHELSRGVPQDRAERDLRAAFDYLSARPDVDKRKIGSVGWDMGGGLALQLAIDEPKLAACVVNYGAMPTDKISIAAIHAPVLGNFGDEDRGITSQDVYAFEKAMRDENKIVDVKVYARAGHGFENPGIKDRYRPKDAADAWGRTVGFLNKALK